MFVREMKNNISLNFLNSPSYLDLWLPYNHLVFFLFHYSDRTKQLKRALVSGMFPPLSSIL